MAQLYTPFLTQAGAAIGRGLERRSAREEQSQRNQLIQKAYMKQPGALEQLMSVDPQAAMQVKKQITEEAQTAVQTTQTEQDRKIKAQQQLAANIAPVRKQLANFENYDQAKAFLDQTLAQNKDLMDVAGIAQNQFTLTPEGFQQLKTAYSSAEGENKVQSSKILPGGVVVKVLDNGNVEVYDPKTESREIVEAAERRGAELQGIRSQERETAKTAAKIAEESFKTLSATRKNIENMDEGIKLLDEGADTGAIESRFPSIKAASVKLDNLKNRLGLDVIGSVTFGALSEAELAMALDTALPTKLDAPDLKQWMIEKRDAQKKLASNLEEAALFLSEPGNTVADFIKIKKQEEKEKQPSAEVQAEGPKVGDIVQGYRFKGGDPSNPNSWEEM